jgi:hypothetical protein
MFANSTISSWKIETICFSSAPLLVEYGNTLWNYVYCLLFHMNGTCGLSGEFKTLKAKFSVTLCKIAWWATLYHIWLQRNARLHDGEVKTEEQIIKVIRKDVKARMEAVIAPDSFLHRTLVAIGKSSYE